MHIFISKVEPDIFRELVAWNHSLGFLLVHLSFYTLWNTHVGNLLNRQDFKAVLYLIVKLIFFPVSGRVLEIIWEIRLWQGVGERSTHYLDILNDYKMDSSFLSWQ